VVAIAHFLNGLVGPSISCSAAIPTERADRDDRRDPLDLDVLNLEPADALGVNWEPTDQIRT
jgi:hypothetical protein